MSEGRGLTPPSPAWSAAQGEPYSTLGRTLCAGKLKEPLSGLGNWGLLFFPPLNKIMKPNALCTVSRNTQGPSALTASHPQPVPNFAFQPPTLALLGLR